MPLFATHYFKLTALPETLDGIANVHVEAREHAGGLVFLYGVRAGPEGTGDGCFALQSARSCAKVKWTATLGL